MEKKHAAQNWKKNITRKNAKLVIEACILKAKEVPFEVLSRPKTDENKLFLSLLHAVLIV